MVPAGLEQASGAALERRQPRFPVRPLRLGGDGGDQLLPEVLTVEGAIGDQALADRERARLPGGVEGMVGRQAQRGATPTMPSRVTRAASSSSDAPSVASGLRGSTM